MCDPKNIRCYEFYDGCKHQLPKKACDYYSHAHGKCFAAADVAKDVNCYEWEEGENYPGLYRFCTDRKDVDGAYQYGLKWKDSAKFK